MRAAVLQIVGGLLVSVAALCVNVVLGVFVAGVLCLAFGIWDEFS